MGARANYVIVEETGYSLWYSHWGAEVVIEDLFWGPTHALSFIRAHEQTNEWLDRRWGEGAALVDPSRRVLLVYPGDDLDWRPRLRRFALELMRHTWPGWRVEWASQGLVDLVDYLGVSRELVRTPELEDEALSADPLNATGDPPVSCVSVRGADGGLRLYASPDDIDVLALSGPSLLSIGARSTPVPRIDELDLSLFGCGGLHVDVERREVVAWSSNAWHDIARRMKAAWEGWRCEWLGDAFERHEALCDGRLTTVDGADVSEELLVSWLCDPDRNELPGRMVGLVQTLTAQGNEVVKHSALTAPEPDRPPRAERERIVAAALAAWRAQQARGG